MFGGLKNHPVSTRELTHSTLATSLQLWKTHGNLHSALGTLGPSQSIDLTPQDEFDVSRHWLFRTLADDTHGDGGVGVKHGDITIDTLATTTTTIVVADVATSDIATTHTGINAIIVAEPATTVATTTVGSDVATATAAASTARGTA